MQEKDDSNDGEEKKEEEDEEAKPAEPARRVSLPDDVEDTNDPIRVKCRELLATALMTKRELYIFGWVFGLFFLSSYIVECMFMLVFCVASFNSS